MVPPGGAKLWPLTDLFSCWGLTINISANTSEIKQHPNLNIIFWKKINFGKQEPNWKVLHRCLWCWKQLKHLKKKPKQNSESSIYNKNNTILKNTCWQNQCLQNPSMNNLMLTNHNLRHPIWKKSTSKPSMLLTVHVLNLSFDKSKFFWRDIV